MSLIILYLASIEMLSPITGNAASIYKCKDSHNQTVYSQEPCIGGSGKVNITDNTADFSFERKARAQEQYATQQAAQKEAARLEAKRTQPRLFCNDTGGGLIQCHLVYPK